MKIFWIFFDLFYPGIPLGSLKNFTPFGPAVLPAIGNIYTNVVFYYINIYIQFPAKQHLVVFDSSNILKKIGLKMCESFVTMLIELLFFKKNYKSVIFFFFKQNKLPD